ncbi:MAG: hypothetical protein WC426_07360 [Sulfuriferula sp.]
MKTHYLACALAIISTVLTSSVFAQSEPTEPLLTFKLTPSYYHISDGNDGTDLNLRAEYGDHYGWIGYYHDRQGFAQTRVGYENHADFGYVRTVVSAQAATHGFIGGSLNAEIGGDTYALLGWGRTNLQDYYNLNFDPNDAVTLGLGTRAIPETELSLFTTADDRLGTGQRVTHLIARRMLDKQQRLSLDVTHKSGTSTEGNQVVGNGIALTYDFEPWFVRVAYDPYVNFTESQMTLFALGKRF